MNFNGEMSPLLQTAGHFSGFFFAVSCQFSHSPSQATPRSCPPHRRDDNRADRVFTTNAKSQSFGLRFYSFHPFRFGYFQGIPDRGRLAALHRPLLSESTLKEQTDRSRDAFAFVLLCLPPMAASFIGQCIH
jgi:hypothetical protein